MNYSIVLGCLSVVCAGSMYGMQCPGGKCSKKIGGGPQYAKVLAVMQATGQRTEGKVIKKTAKPLDQGIVEKGKCSICFDANATKAFCNINDHNACQSCHDAWKAKSETCPSCSN